MCYVMHTILHGDVFAYALAYAFCCANTYTPEPDNTVSLEMS